MAYQVNNNGGVYFTGDYIVIVDDYEFLRRNVVANRNGQLDRHHGIESLLYFYIGGHGAILTAVFSLNGVAGWEILLSTVILSLLLSAIIISRLVIIIVEQFNLIRGGGQLRNSLIYNWRWFAHRVVFVVMLIAISSCLLICRTYALLPPPLNPP